MNKSIPLVNGIAYQRFSVTLGKYGLRFYLRWLTRYGYFQADIYDRSNNPIALSRGLHVGMDLLAGLNTSIGKIVLEGDQPTIRNLGIDNRLVWYGQ